MAGPLCSSSYIWRTGGFEIILQNVYSYIYKMLMKFLFFNSFSEIWELKVREVIFNLALTA